MKICICTDDNAGFSKKEAAAKNIFILRMPLIINGEVYFQGENIDLNTYMERLKNGDDSQTSQPSPGELMELWRKCLKNYDHIIHIPLSSGLSEACNTAKNLAEDEEFKDKVTVVDNHRVEPTLKEAVYDALNLIDAGYSPKEIKEILEKEKGNASIYVMVDTLKFLKKGGRVTPAAALLGGALHIKPVLSLFDGKLDAYQKAIGSKKAKQIIIAAIKKNLETKFKNYDKNEDLAFYYAYTDNQEEAKLFAEEAKEELGIKQITPQPLSLIVTNHVGPGVLALAVCAKVKAKKK